MTVTDERHAAVELDLRAEFDRLVQLDAFSYHVSGYSQPHRPLVALPPSLEVRRARLNQSRRYGTAWTDTNRVRVYVHEHLDRYDYQETLLHELTHIVADARAAERVHHGRLFWRIMDAAFAEAYGDLTVAPRTNVHHGRYAAALRQHALDQSAHETVDRIDELLLETERVHRSGRESIAPERLPEPLKSLVMRGEPPRPIEYWFDGIDHERVSGRRRPPITARVRSVRRVIPHVADRRVLAVINDYPGRSRRSIQAEYERRHGPYPGKSVYNSMWRLRRDHLIYREGHHWYRSLGD